MFGLKSKESWGKKRRKKSKRSTFFI